MKFTRKIQIIGILVLISLSSCAPSANTPDEYGFLSGIWHGLSILFVVIAKVFGSDSYSLFALHNTGTMYWIGYLIGIGILVRPERIVNMRK